MKRYITAIFALAALVSCNIDDKELADAVELGVVDRQVLVPEEGSDAVQVRYYANTEVSLRLLDEAPWLSLDRSSVSRDGTLALSVQPNDGFRRCARVEFISGADSRRDTLSVYQKGEVDTLVLKSSGVIIYNNMGDTEVELSTNLDPSSVKAVVRYMDGGAGQWVQAVKLRPSSLTIRTADNPSDTLVRSAVLTLSWTDAWKQECSASINLTQSTSSSSGNNVGVPVSFEDLRAMAGSDPLVINDDIYIEGYIVSDNASGNVCENPQTTSTIIDYTATERAAVIESLDGRYGFLLETMTEEDNVFSKDTKVLLMLNGAQIRRYDNPERYVITNIRASRVAQSVYVGSSVIPRKRKHIGELLDSDIYTRVTLTDCEFPVRKGSLTPLNEGYTLLYGSDRVTKFPTLLRDIDGSSLYMYTNTTCPYRRDGTRIGYGSGSVTGIIVHEKYRCFIDADAATEEECGNIGRYQIRHQSREDLAFADDFADSFSALICEWRYLTYGDADHSWPATAGSGSMTHTHTAGLPNSTWNTWCYPVYDQSYLGPVNRGSTTNKNGFGIILPDGSDYASAYTGSVDKGQLLGSSGWPMAWMKETWVNNAGTFYAWEIHFSTKGIRTEHLSLQISTLNASQEGMSPVHWKVQWASTNTLSTTWNDIATYSVPDVVLNSLTQPWQSNGYKPMDFVLPLEMLDRDDVYIRLTPADRAGNTPQGYCDANFKNGTAGSSGKANNALNYVAVRYNK